MGASSAPPPSAAAVAAPTTIRTNDPSSDSPSRYHLLTLQAPSAPLLRPSLRRSFVRYRWTSRLKTTHCIVKAQASYRSWKLWRRRI